MISNRHKMKFKRGIEIPISIVLFAIVGLMVFTILLGFIPRVIGGLLGAFLGQTSAMKAQSLDDARGICQQWCAAAKMATSPQRFLDSKYCKSLVAVPSTGGSACLIQSIPNNWDGRVYISGLYLNVSGSCTRITGLNNSLSNIKYDSGCNGNAIKSINVYCGREADKIKCNIIFDNVPTKSIPIKQVCLAYNYTGSLPNKDEYIMIVSFNSYPSSTTVNIGSKSYTIVDCETPTPNSIGGNTKQITVAFRDPCSDITDKNQCTSPCRWTSVSGYVTKHCYEPPISVQCSTPPIVTGTVTYTCASTESGCVCYGSDGTKLTS